MLEYFLLDWRDFGLPVYPVAVLSHPKFNPQTKSPLNLRIRDQEILKFHFAVIDLGRLGAMEHVRKLNAAADLATCSSPAQAGAHKPTPDSLTSSFGSSFDNVRYQGRGKTTYAALDY